MKTFISQVMVLSLLLVNAVIAQIALDFDSVDDYVSSTATLSQDDNFTLEAYVQYQPPSVPQIYKTIVGFRSAVQIVLYSNRDVADNSSGFAANDAITLNDGQWYHLALVRETGVWKMYVDGVFYEVEQRVAPTPDAADTFNVGGRGVQQSFTGVIEEVRGWTVARSQAEIQQYMHRCLTGQEAGLYLYYRMDDGAGSATVTDMTSNGNDGTLNNMDVTKAWLSGVGIDCSGLDELCVPVKAASWQYSVCS